MPTAQHPCGVTYVVRMPVTCLRSLTFLPSELARSLFASCDKDWKLRIYKTAGNKLILEKQIQGIAGLWTITDHNLSLDNDWLIYSSITPYVHLTRTAADAPDAHHRLDFSTGDEDNAVWPCKTWYTCCNISTHLHEAKTFVRDSRVVHTSIC